MKRISLLYLVLLFSHHLCYAQTDTAFWFAAPDVSSDFGYDRPIFMRMSSGNQTCHVTISEPAGGGLTTQTFTIPPYTTQSVDLTTWINNIECSPGDVIQNRGIEVTSDNSISAYYEADAGGPNPEIFSLKGRNALGTEFYISSQYLLNNSPEYVPAALSSFNIVASEDNTTVTITPSNNIVGHSAGIPFTITLNKGQTYAAIAVSQLAAQHLQGSHVTSTKPVAITLADDLLAGGPYGAACRDLAGDQTIPVNVTGTEYIAVKTLLNYPYDKIYITATQNGTTVTQDGSLITTLSAGQSTELSMSNNSTYIQTSAPSYTYQLAGLGCEVSAAILPKINCTGSSAVSVTRSSTDGFAIVLLVKNGGQNNFLVNNMSGIINAAQFNVVPNTSGQWYEAEIDLSASYPVGSTVRVTNSTNLFQMGTLQGGVGSGESYGYFSDFNTFKSNASLPSTVCAGSPLQLSADTVASATYSWTGPHGYTSNLQNPEVTNTSGYTDSGKYILTTTLPGCGSSHDTLDVPISNCGPALCTGTLGAPIVNITFGSGSSNPGPQLSAAVPGATTTYTFASYAVGNPPSPPPNDGYYELANVVPFNSAWFTGAPDHTGNTNGYMAMFNASPSPGEFYRQTVTSLCPGTTYEFAAWIANVVDPAILPGAILPNITFNILDPTTNAVLASYNTGDIAMSSSMTWKQYGSLFTMPAGLSSIILVLSNNNIGGGAQPGNDLVIDDITFRPCGPTTIAALDKDSICQGNNVTLEGNVSGGLHNPAYQWQISTDGGVTFVDIPGATTLNYTESSLTQGTYQFQLLSAEAGNINTATCRFVSNAVSLTVSNCVPVCKSSFDFTRAAHSIVSVTATPPASTNQLYNANGFTWEGWVRLKAPITNQSLIISTEDAVPYQDIFLGFGWAATPNALSFMISDNGANNATVAAESLQNLTVGTWYHIAAVCDYNNAQLLLYLDGNLIATQTIPANILSNRLSSNHLVQIGNASAAANGIDADIDEVQFWNIVKTQADIQNGMTQCIALPKAGLVAYFKADENSGTTAYSAVNNNFIGTLQNTNWSTQVPAVNCPGVSVSDSSTSCSSFNFKGFASNPSSITSWQWFFDDGTTATGQNVSHNFSIAGNHIAKLITTNTNGCSDSSTTSVTSSFLTVNAGNDSLVCKNSPFSLSGSGTNIVQYAWTPKTYLSDSTLQNPTATITATTKFYLAATNAAGCTAVDSVTMTVQNLPVKTNNDTAVCAGNTIQLNTNGANSYSWSPSTGLTNTGIANPVDTSTAANTIQYIVKGTSTIGCSANDTVNITINPNPVVQTNNDTAICNGSFVQLNTTGANTYSWTPITNISNPGIGNPTAHPTSLTQYVVTGTISSTGCSAKDSVTITVNQKPTIIKSNDTTICNNASVQLVATGGTGYQWTPAATLTDPTINNPVASPIANTTYDVTVTDANNCSNRDSIKVTIRPTPVFTVTPDTLVCSLGAVQLNASGGDIYSWTPSSLVDNPAISDPHAITNTTTTYTVHITESACNVSADLTTKLSLAPPLNITINKANDIDCSNGSSQLLASGADNYIWISGSGLNKNNVPSPIATPLTTQQYVVKGNTADGCVGYDSITVFVNFTDNDNGYYVPSAFTPNGDRLNDCFGIKNWGVLEQFDLSIYNRWGTRIFHTNNQTDCWDGTFQEERSDQDTYIYIITATTPCGNVFRKGSLTLIR